MLPYHIDTSGKQSICIEHLLKNAKPVTQSKMMSKMLSFLYSYNPTNGTGVVNQLRDCDRAGT